MNYLMGNYRVLSNNIISVTPKIYGKNTSIVSCPCIVVFNTCWYGTVPYLEALIRYFLKVSNTVPCVINLNDKNMCTCTAHIESILRVQYRTLHALSK